MKNKFEDLLVDLSELLDTELLADSNNACSIIFDETLEVQLELDESEENLIVYSSICPVPPGKFRENVLLQALKENDKFPFIGILGYYEAETSLCLFNYLYFDDMTPDLLSSYLSLFVEYAFLYREAISKGQTTPSLKPS